VPTLDEYHRPTDLAAAIATLRRPRPRTVPLAGGTWLNPRLGKEVEATAVVDLSELGLAGIERDPDTLRLGPMATLADVAEDECCQTLASGLLATTARRDAVVNVRNAATVGGTVVVAPPDSELILALLALDAHLTVQSDGVRSWSLTRFLADRTRALNGGLITQVQIHLPLQAAGGLAHVTRTPFDHPIVAAVAVISEDPDARRIALGGVASRPLVVTFERIAEADGAVAKAIDSAEPYGDFRGTADYRREMGALMARRALEHAVANLGGRQQQENRS
jgi:CO/xanthine dehydrogenase FAD-binding subunit